MSAEEHLPEREARVARMLRAAAETERAPDSLHRAVAAMRERPMSARAGRPGPLRRALAMPALAATATAIVLVLGTGGAGAPSLAQAAALAQRGPAAPAPEPDPGAPGALLNASVGGLHFPDWRADGGWRSVGERRDTIGDRRATTVYYAAAGRRVAYSILSSPILRIERTYDEPYETLREHGRTYVVWQQRGHTCLLSGAGLSAASLWRLASSSARS